MKPFFNTSIGAFMEVQWSDFPRNMNCRLLRHYHPRVYIYCSLWSLCTGTITAAVCTLLAPNIDTEPYISVEINTVIHVGALGGWRAGKREREKERERDR